jgi:hypothetical protein
MGYKENCGVCQFFIRTAHPSPAYGACVRYPKHEDKHEIDWCGEWHPIRVPELSGWVDPEAMCICGHNAITHRFTGNSPCDGSGCKCTAFAPAYGKLKEPAKL